MPIGLTDSMSQPRFQLAARRAVFFSLCLSFWLLFGTVLFAAFHPHGESKKKSGRQFIFLQTEIRRSARLDMKRTDLLNVLWAETIAKTELDWAEMANHKMDIYEKALLAHYGIDPEDDGPSFSNSFTKAFSMISTIGPIEADDFSMFGKILVIPYVLVGAPICLLIVGQIGRMITSVWTGLGLIIPTVILVFFSSVVYDIVEGGDDDLPFFDGIFSIFVQFATIGDEESEFHGIIPYIVLIFGVSLMSVVFVQIQHEIERALHPLEFSFNNLYGAITQWISMEKENGSAFEHAKIIEEDEEEEDD
ncbi:hypothetical protein WR25_19394 [Diploscapter pachys]|uniref:Potassium channel domain-containing protein n=1 Tax=Diploscapter pachys TaxID=2018661 RepID=A0A2A2K987_9BILA|nr:hypothetical protein WR25_19394 [Diploscapter pachys]